MSTTVISSQLGRMCAEHEVPAGCEIVRLCYCQNCGRPFFGKNTLRAKYCLPCCQRYLLPVDFGYYLEMAPAHTHLERDLPHYDKELQ